MRINFVCEQFIKGQEIKGACMSVDDCGDKTILSYRYNRSNDGLIAEILNRKNGDYTLILHPRPSSYGKTSHNNRLWGILKAIGGEYSGMRYSCYVRYHICIEDRKLGVVYHLEDRPLKFNYRGGKLVVDYADLESHAVPEGEQQPVVEPNSNNNIQNELGRLTTILNTV